MEVYLPGKVKSAFRKGVAGEVELEDGKVRVAALLCF